MGKGQQCKSIDLVWANSVLKQFQNQKKQNLQIVQTNPDQTQNSKTETMVKQEKNTAKQNHGKVQNSKQVKKRKFIQPENLEELGRTLKVDLHRINQNVILLNNHLYHPKIRALVLVVVWKILINFIKCQHLLGKNLLLQKNLGKVMPVKGKRDS